MKVVRVPYTLLTLEDVKNVWKGSRRMGRKSCFFGKGIVQEVGRNGVRAER